MRELILIAGLALLPAAGCGRASAPAPSSRSAPTTGMVYLPGGHFTMGTSDAFPYEEPPHEVELDPFWLDRYEVTNAEFRRFVAATGYVTEAERFGWSVVFDPAKQDWIRVDKADWRHPEGPESSLAGRDREPVVQVSWNDAGAFARWAGKRLPTEAEFEFALRGGQNQTQPYSWGPELSPGGVSQANLWQGAFPERDQGRDGYHRAAPVGSFPPGPFGLHDLTGNVWEWCADWYDDHYYGHSPLKNPRGPDQPDHGTARVLRGGSFLCSENYCQGYRVSARSSCDADSATNHMGFRCALPTRASGTSSQATPATQD